MLSNIKQNGLNNQSILTRFINRQQEIASNARNEERNLCNKQNE